MARRNTGRRQEEEEREEQNVNPDQNPPEGGEEEQSGEEKEEKDDEQEPHERNDNLVFRLTPYGMTLNLGEEKDMKLFKSASSPFEHTFDGEARNASAFIDKLRARANHIQCLNIFTVEGERGNRMSIFDKWQSIEPRKIRREATYRWNINDWNKQAAYITGKVIMESLSEDFRARVIQHKQEYEIEVDNVAQIDGPMLCKTVLDMVFIQTDMEGFTIRETLSKITLKDYKYNLIEVHKRVLDLVAQLRSTPDEISDNATKLHLINIYKTAKSDKFCDFIEQLQNMGRLPAANELIKLAEKKYQQLMDSGLWMAPSKHEQLMAFKIEVAKLKKENKSLKKQGKRKSSSKNSPSKKRKVDEDWITKPPKKGEHTTKKKDGKTWNWCKFHNKWVVARSQKFGEHTSETCLLNPKNKEVNKEKKLKVTANLAEEHEPVQTDSDSERSAPTESSEDTSSDE